MKTDQNWKIILALFSLVLTSLACTLSGTQTPINPTSVPQVIPTQNPPTALPPQPSATVPPNAYFEGISFTYDPGLMKGVFAQTLEATAPESDSAPFFVIHPKEYTFDIQGYHIPQGLKPQIIVFSPSEYEKMVTPADPNPVTKTMAQFTKLMADRPVSTSGALPFLPMQNSGEIMQFQMKYLQFQNGSGVRYLTEFGQAPGPLSNNLLVYTFQALTQDGAYYISAILPVNHAPIPGDKGEEMVKQDYSKFMENFPAYVVDVQNKMNTEKGDSFDPPLETLDRMMESIKISK